MDEKLTLPRRIQTHDAIYQLAYVPGMDYMEPNYAAMRPQAADCTEVNLMGKKQWMSWVLMDAPARIGSATPPKRYLLFRLYPSPIPPNPAMFSDMIAYAAHPIDSGLSPAQAFLNALVGQREQELQKNMPKDDWAQRMFNIIPNEDEDMAPASSKMASASEEAFVPEVIAPEQ